MVVATVVLVLLVVVVPPLTASGGGNSDGTSSSGTTAYGLLLTAHYLVTTLCLRRAALAPLEQSTGASLLGCTLAHLDEGPPHCVRLVAAACDHLRLSNGIYEVVRGWYLLVSHYYSLLSCHLLLTLSVKMK